MALTTGERGASWLLAGLPALAAAVLTVLIAYSLANLGWRVFAPAPEVSAPAATRNVDLPDAARERPDYALAIANLHLFGDAPEVQPRLVDAPDTRLNLALRGIYATGNDRALAIIASDGSNEKFYRLGDAIVGGGVLKAVYGDRVILEHNQRMETLRLPRSRLNLNAKKAGSHDANNTEGYTDAAQAYAAGYDNPVPDAGASAATGSDYLPDGGSGGVDLGAVRQQILQDPGRLGDMLRVTPARENGNGQFLGYQLTPQGNTQLFEQIGLQEGDIVTSVNGIAIDRPDKGLLALQDLVKAEQVSVTLLRNGTEITVEHSLR
ncbi:MAG: type II secretion system protein GspC [Gammaproteobacteria bacterium]|nr:type II secretion system protein GspC [Gammaproteobacteria bacterium]